MMIMGGHNQLSEVGKILTTDNTSKNQNVKSNTANGLSFEDVLKNSINQQNELMVDSEKAMVDLSSGQLKDIHQAAITIGKAETSMKLVLEVRNKAVSAYKEILRTQL